MNNSSHVRFPAVLVLLAAVAALLGACGESDGRLSKDEYVEKVNAAQEPLAKFATVQADVADDPAQTARQIDALVEDLEATVEEVRALEPPREWQEHHDLFVEGMAESIDGIKAMQTALETNDAAAVSTATTKATSGQAKIDEAIAAINADL